MSGIHEEVSKNLLKYAVQRAIFCPSCKHVLDVDDAVLVDAGGSSMIRCGKCFDSWALSLKPGSINRTDIEVTDGRPHRKTIDYPKQEDSDMKKRQPTTGDRVIFERKALAKRLTLLAKTVPGKHIPVLANVIIFKSSSHTATLKTTDLEVLTSCDIPINNRPGTPFPEIGINTRGLAKFVRNSKADYVSLTVISGAGHSLKVQAESNGITQDFVAVSTNEFPSTLPTPAPWQSFPAADLHAAIAAALPAASEDETRYNLNGILLQNKGQRLRAVATDGRRLVYRDIKKGALEGLAKDGAIVPLKVWASILPLIKKLDDNIEIAVDEKHIAFRIDNTLIVARLIEGTYPNYLQVVPKNNPTTLIVNRSAWIDKLKAVLPGLSKRTGALVFNLSPDGKHVDMSGGDATEGGKVKARAGVVLTGPPITCTFGINARYLIDALEGFDCEAVSIDIKETESRPNSASNELEHSVITPLGISNAKTNGLTVVMPQRTK